MAPRPSVGVPGPRAMPPYKYATGVRNPNPPVVQPIALQQVWTKRPMRSPCVSVMSRSQPRNNFHYFAFFLPFARLSQLYMFRVRSLSQPPCWLLHPPRSRNRCWVKLPFHNEYTILLFTFYYVDLYSFFQNRGASFPTDSGHACQPGRKDHRHVAGDRQLWTASYAGVSWVSAFKGTSLLMSLPRCHGNVLYSK